MAFKYIHSGLPVNLISIYVLNRILEIGRNEWSLGMRRPHQGAFFWERLTIARW